MGSSSYITNLDGEIVQHVEYVPFGEVFIEERNNSLNSPYLFNGKELDEETGLYYYGARYYNPRESVWLSTELLSGYNPIMEFEHFIDGQHNGGVYNSFNLNTNIYCYQNPVILVDPNGKQALAGAILGAFTEYGSIVGGKMLFENKSFLQAYKDVSWGEAASIGVAAGFGAISGVAKFTTWAGSSTGRKILVKMLEVGLGAAEDVIKQAVNLKEGESIDINFISYRFKNRAYFKRDQP